MGFKVTYTHRLFFLWNRSFLKHSFQIRPSYKGNCPRTYKVPMGRAQKLTALSSQLEVTYTHRLFFLWNRSSSKHSFQIRPSYKGNCPRSYKVPMGRAQKVAALSAQLYLKLYSCQPFAGWGWSFKWTRRGNTGSKIKFLLNHSQYILPGHVRGTKI